MHAPTMGRTNLICGTPAESHLRSQMREAKIGGQTEGGEGCWLGGTGMWPSTHFLWYRMFAVGAPKPDAKGSRRQRHM